MARDEAKIKFNADCREFNAQIKSANATLKEMRAELQLNAETSKRTGDEIGALQNQERLLQEAYDASGAKVEAMRGKLIAAIDNYGAGSDQAAKWSAELAKAQTEQEKLRQQLDACTKSLLEHYAELGRDETATEKLSATMAQQEEKLAGLKQAYVDACLQYGKNSEEAKRLAAQIETTSTELRKNKDAMSEAEQAADSFDHTLGEQKSTFQQLRENMAELNQAINAFGSAWRGVDTFITNQIRKGFKELVGLTKDIAESVVETGMQTEASFAKVSAVMQATDDDMALLRDKALEVQQGLHPLPYTLNDCATAYYYMGLAGWDAQQSGDALKDTLSLVMASGEDLANVSDIVTDNITAFGLSSKDTKYMVDVLAQTMRSTNTDVGLLGQTFKYAAMSARGAGYNLEDVALAAGLMANNGIKGSQAGTQLRQMFNQLAAPTDKAAALMDKYGISMTDSEGKMLSLKGMLDQTRVAFAGMSVNLYDAEGNLRDYDDILQEVEQTNQDYVAAEKLKAAATIYGTRAMSGVLSIVNMTEEEYQRVTADIYNYNDACQEMADIMNDTLEGDIQMLNASLDTLANQVYDNVSPALRGFIQELTGWVNSDQSVELINQIGTELRGLLDGVLWNLPNIIQNISTILHGVPAAISAVASAITFVTQHINGIITAIKAVVIVWGTVRAIDVASHVVQIGASLVQLIAKIVAVTGATQAQTVATAALNIAQNATPWGIALAGAAALAAGIVALVKHIASLNDNTAECNARIQAVVQNITPFRDGMASLTATFHQTNEQMERMTDIDQQIADGENRITEAIRQAVKDHGTLRDEEIAKYEQANQRFAELEAERLAIYREGVTNIGYEIQASIQSINGMTQAEIQQYHVDLEAALKSSNEAVDAACDAEIDRINQYYKARGESGSAAHLQEIEAAKAHAAEEKAVNEQMYNENLATLTTYAAKAVEGDMDMWRQVYANSKKGREKYTANMEQVNLDGTEAFLSLWAEARKAGVAIPQEVNNMAAEILTSFVGLPSQLQEQGRNVLGGLIGGMEETFPQLQYASEATCTEIVTTIANGLQVQSPSRVMIGIGGNVVQGLADGMNSKGSAVNAAATNLATGIIKSLTPNPNSANAIGQNTVAAVGSGLTGKQGAVTGAAQGVAKGVIASLTPDAGAVKNVGANTVSQDQQGLQSKLSAISNTAKSINQSVVKSLTPDAGAVKNVGANTVSQDQQGMQSKSGALNNTAKTIAQGAVKSLTPDGNQVKSIGGNIVAGIDTGMQDKKGWLGSRIASLASGIVSKFKAAFSIGSPSRVMAEEIGEWLPAGIGKGIEDNAGAATQPLKALVNSMTGAKLGLGNTLGGFSLDISSRIEDHMMDAFNNNSQFSMMERMADAMERLANIEFIVNMDISGQRVAQATASASDSVSGTRINLRERGLALE